MLKRIFLRSVLAALSAVSLAAAQAQPADSTLDQDHVARLELTHGKPFVMVSINGQGPFRFVIDTGTGGQAFVSSALARELNLPQIGHMHLSDPSGKGSKVVPMVLLPSLAIAGVTFTAVRAAVHDLDDSDGPCQGLLGFLLFRGFLLTLDYPNRQMRLTSGAITPDGEHSVLPFRMPDGIPLIPLHIGNSVIEAQLDSGGAGLSLPEDFAQRMSFASDPINFSNSNSLTTRFQVKGGKLATDVRLGDYTFPQPFIEINPAFPLANFGACPMQNFIITFDQEHELVRFSATRQTIHLAATPAPMRLDNSPKDQLPDPTLVPVG